MPWRRRQAPAGPPPRQRSPAGPGPMRASGHGAKRRKRRRSTQGVSANRSFTEDHAGPRSRWPASCRSPSSAGCRDPPSAVGDPSAKPLRLEARFREDSQNTHVRTTSLRPIPLRRQGQVATPAADRPARVFSVQRRTAANLGDGASWAAAPIPSRRRRPPPRDDSRFPLDASTHPRECARRTVPYGTKLFSHRIRQAST